MSASEALIRLALRLAPRAFRELHGAELLHTHRRRMRDAAKRRAVARARLWIRELVGVITLGMKLRLHSWRSGAGAGGRGERGSLPESIAQDARFAVRGLLRNPLFAVTAVAVFALGSGARTATFTALNAFFFRPLPFADADRLMLLYETNPEFGWTDASAAPANVLDWREQVSAFDDVAAFSELTGPLTVLVDERPVVLTAVQITGNFFDVLGVHATVGRTPVWDDTWERADPDVVLSERAWRTHFGADPAVIGRTITLGSSVVRIAAVMPAGFTFPGRETDLWHSFNWAPGNRAEVWFRRAHFVRPIARLASGVSPDVAAAELQVVVERLQQEYPQTNSVMGAGMMPVRDFLIRGVRRPLIILFSAVVLLLVLACANVANLTLVRGAERSREVALRHALGAGRGRIVRQLLVESSVLAAVGGAVGVVLGWTGVRALQLLTPLGIDGATTVVLDGRVVLFAFAASLVSALLFGLVPALRTAGGPLGGVIGSEARATSGRERLRTIRALVTAEVALALLLVAAAGLMTRSFLLMRAVDPGFRTDGTLAVQLTAPATRYTDPAAVLAFQDRLLTALEAKPGVERAGIVGQLPLAGVSWTSQFQAHGWPPDRVGFEVVHRRANAGYFEALGIPLVRGRMFDRRDGPDAPRVVLVNESFAREHFAGEDVLGRRIAFDRVATDSSRWHEIIGVVADQHQESLAQPVRAEVFEHSAQDWGRTVWIVMRTSAEANSVLPAAREALRELDPLIPLTRVRPLREVWHASMAREEFILTLLACFGTVALLLAAAGVHGVAAQAARLRTREIGIRMALGAGTASVIAVLLRPTLAAVALGLLTGLALALAGGRALATVLFGIAPHDAATLAAVSAVLAAVAALACYVPARRALARDPIQSLRTD